MIDAHQKCVKRNKRDNSKYREKNKTFKVSINTNLFYSPSDWHQKRLYTACVSLNLAIILTEVRRQPLYSKVLVVCAKRSLARMRLEFKKKMHNFQINKKKNNSIIGWIIEKEKKILFKWIYFEKFNWFWIEFFLWDNLTNLWHFKFDWSIWTRGEKKELKLFEWEKKNTNRSDNKFRKIVLKYSVQSEGHHHKGIITNNYLLLVVAECYNLSRMLPFITLEVESSIYFHAYLFNCISTCLLSCSE